MQMELQSTEIQASSLPPLSYQETTVLPIFKAAFTIIIICAAISTIITILYDCLPKRQWRFFVSKKQPEVPCDCCHYLSCNPHLKCALHPVAVLTIEAVDCKDYHPNNEKKLVEKIKGLLQIVQNIFLN
jgi:hypothetical protein